MKRIAIAAVIVSRLAHASPDEQPRSDDRPTYVLFGAAAVFGVFAVGEAKIALQRQDEAEKTLPAALRGDELSERDYAIALGARDDARRDALIAGGGALVLAGLGTWRAMRHPPSAEWFDRSWKIRAGCDAIAIGGYAVAASLPQADAGSDGAHISGAALAIGALSVATYGLCAPIVHARGGDFASAGLSLATNVALPLATYYGRDVIGFDDPYGYRPSRAPLWVGPVAAMALDLFMLGKLDGEHAVVVEPRGNGGVVSFGGQF